MNKNRRVANNQVLNTVEVKSKFGAEFRRFSLERSALGHFHEFLVLLQHVHLIPNEDLLVKYADPQGLLLPINNDGNYHKAISSARPLLRLFIQRTEEANQYMFVTDATTWKQRALATVFSQGPKLQKHGVVISQPWDFRPVSSVVDVSVLPEWMRRVRLHRRGSDRPLGFYIRDGTTVRLTPQGPERVPGVFISRVVPGGLAESTGLLGVNDEVLEVNGVPVAGKSLHQVTDMMIANSHNLIVTVMPANQSYNVVRAPAAGSRRSLGTYQNFLLEEEEDEKSELEKEGEESEEEDLVVEAGWGSRPVPRYELHMGLKQSGPVGPSSSLGSLSISDSEQGELEESSLEEEGTVLTL
ncbi:partitioning defective 6 homolog beta-like [Paramormyrops kingsleyae]|uniref:Partitioning defective 6 homolog beta-like n=1 Tax=Paramormyrops kingsleyae TaxID=1676925 RepID=A0A3B3TET4_9TELE|nr:partitioning defective 6 homolog beta-like [Paramormyrops kingsleyae]